MVKDRPERVPAARSGRRREGITTLGMPSYGSHGIAPRRAQTVGHDAPPDGGSVVRDEECGWGPLGDHTVCARADDPHVDWSRTPLAPPLSSADAYSHVLGVKGSQVQILASRRAKPQVTRPVVSDKGPGSRSDVATGVAMCVRYQANGEVPAARRSLAPRHVDGCRAGRRR